MAVPNRSYQILPVTVQTRSAPPCPSDRRTCIGDWTFHNTYLLVQNVERRLFNVTDSKYVPTRSTKMTRAYLQGQRKVDSTNPTFWFVRDSACSKQIHNVPHLILLDLFRLFFQNDTIHSGILYKWNNYSRGESSRPWSLPRAHRIQLTSSTKQYS